MGGASETMLMQMDVRNASKVKNASKMKPGGRQDEKRVQDGMGADDPLELSF